MQIFDLILSLLVGVGLSAACGFRIFIPPLIISIACKAGHLTLGADYGWVASDAALVAFSMAAVLEVTAYYVPWLDNFLDVISTPAAIVVGTIMTSSMVSGLGLDPFMQWTMAAILGGGTAAAVQVLSVKTRAASTGITAGAGNFIVATVELLGSTVLSSLAILIPVLLILGVIGLGLLWMWMRKSKEPKINIAG